MKAVYISEFGGPENLEIRDVEEPHKPKGNEVLVAVSAAALNRADILQRKGLYPAPKGFPERLLGLEFAGEIIEIGESIRDFKLGDRVFGITAGGAQAEFLLIEADQLSLIPKNLSFQDAAAIPEAFITAYDAIFSQGNLKNDETLLIHAVGSGVGLAALQLAKAKGIRAIGTSRSAEKLERCSKYGLDEGILMETETNFAELIKRNNKGTDVILDLVGGCYFQQNLESLNLKGRLILVGLTGGAKTEFNLGIALAKRLQIIGTVLRSRSKEEKAEVAKIFSREIVPLFENETLKPDLDRVFHLSDVRQAHEYLESNESFGKVILKF